MSKHKPVIKTYICLLVFMLLAGALVYVHAFAQTHLPAAYEVKRQDKDKAFLSFQDFEALGLLASSAYCEVETRINQGIPDAKTVLTNDKYDDLFQLTFVAGGFFDGAAMTNALPYAVISDQLSLQLFLRVNAIGEKIEIDDNTYEIVGVYQSDHSFWGCLSKDKYDRIFIPYTTYPAYESQILSAVVFPCNVGLPRTVDRLNLTNHDKSFNFWQTNYQEMLDCATQFMPGMIFLFTILEMILMIKIAYSAIKRYVQTIYAHRRDGYFLETVRSHGKEFLFALLITSASAAMITWLTKGLQFPVALPASSIPPDNLFDLAYYREELMRFFMSRNTYLLSGNNYYVNLAEHSVYAGVILSFCLFPMVLLLYHQVKELVEKNQVHFVEMISYLCLSLGLMALLNVYAGSVLLQNFITLLSSVLLLFFVFFMNIKFKSSSPAIISHHSVQS